MSTDWSVTLPGGIVRPGAYAVESDEALAGAIQAALKDEVDADVRPVSELNGIRVRDDVRPLELLLGLGRLTSALPGLHRIGAGGMPGLTALRTASRWAIIRYLWAFADHRPDLRLSNLTDEVRFHQRTLLSESFGIALAADLINTHVLPDATRVVDADAVDYDPVLKVDMAALASHKPDYFWYRVDGDRLTDIVVVEVKGTTSGRRRCIDQMARGVEQVLVPAQVDGVAMRRIVVGTELQDWKLKVRAVEVANPDDAVRRQAYEIVRSREPRRMTVTDGRRVERFGREVAEEAALEESFVLDQVRLHAFAGVPVADPSQFANSDQVRRTLAQREVVVFDDFGFRCEATHVDAGDQILTVRTGVAEEFLSSSDAYRSKGSTQRRSAYRQRRTDRGQAPTGDQSTGTATGSYIATASDGCLLEVSVENR